MEQISVLDIFKVGVGPSSSHTVGPWKAALKSIAELKENQLFDIISSLEVDLYGSLAKTGKGHGTGLAIVLGLLGENPVDVDTTTLFAKANKVRAEKQLLLNGEKSIPFGTNKDLRYNWNESLPFHPNGLRFTYNFPNREPLVLTYYSIGGGFVVQEDEPLVSNPVELPYPIHQASQLLDYCHTLNAPVWQIVYENEKAWRTPAETDAALMNIWQTMLSCAYRGCHTEGELPGGLSVRRRAWGLNYKLSGSREKSSPAEWLDTIRSANPTFHQVLKWVSCFAIAVNEENAAFGRVVTAPTNGSAGVIPAVLLYYLCFCENAKEEDVIRFLLVAGELGSLFKKGATISAALGGCQAEIGVSSAMAAGALTECLGGNVEQVLMAAEIAMEHHLGLTCDPVGGLVQIPCIERNSMGAVKAITAANIALESDPADAKVTLDSVIKSMWETAQDMNLKYKETSEGGLAVNIPANVIEC